jgi:hypothetical protein
MNSDLSLWTATDSGGVDWFIASEILQACDSRWWEWRDALAAIGVAIHFLCPDDMARMRERRRAEP